MSGDKNSILFIEKNEKLIGGIKGHLTGFVCDNLCKFNNKKLGKKKSTCCSLRPLTYTIRTFGSGTRRSPVCIHGIRALLLYANEKEPLAVAMDTTIGEIEKINKGKL